MSRRPASLKETQENYEQRFNCMICLCPRLHMITGICQHRLCSNCLYANDLLRSNFIKCPVCQNIGSFPYIRPEIPEDNIEMMLCLGVRSCPNSGCDLEMWEWEIEDHMKTCMKKTQSPKMSKSRKRSCPRSSKPAIENGPREQKRVCGFHFRTESTSK